MHRRIADRGPGERNLHHHPRRVDQQRRLRRHAARRGTSRADAGQHQLHDHLGDRRQSGRRQRAGGRRQHVQRQRDLDRSGGHPDRWRHRRTAMHLDVQPVPEPGRRAFAFRHRRGAGRGRFGHRDHDRGRRVRSGVERGPGGEEVVPGRRRVGHRPHHGPEPVLQRRGFGESARAERVPEGTLLPA